MRPVSNSIPQAQAAIARHTWEDDLGGCATISTEGRRENVCSRGLEISGRETAAEAEIHFLSLIARSTSRPASRALMVARRSYCFFPFASASSTFASPRFEK